ncbi:MAG: polyprenyl synthetase family protein [Actinomycetes bacterium]
MTSPSRAASPLDAENLRARVQDVVTDFLDQQHLILTSISPEAVRLNEALSDLLAGGKRLRPAFCYWGWRAAGGSDCQEAIVAASSLEFLQACALIHDDVMDGSDTRRGMPAAHRRFATLHRGAGWLGSSENFGVGAAILLGDLCLSWADEVLYTCGLDADSLRRGKGVYDIMRTELMTGQYLDLLEQAVGGGSVERALTVVRYKSAKYTVERPLHLGASLAGADDQVIATLSDYGLPLGEAFQLRDDVLGVFGDPSQTGKPAGDDLREGKRTVLIAETLESCSTAEADVVRRHLGDPALSLEGVSALRDIITTSGALARVESTITEYTERALTAVRSPLFAPEAVTVLEGLAIAATSRSM